VYISRGTRYALAAFTTLVFVVLYFPIAYIARLSVNKAQTYAWPPQGYTLHWWQQAWHAPGPRDALLRSLQTAALATIIALGLGTLVSFALTRYRFIGRNSVSLFIVLPIALPGIVTGLALNSGFHRVGINLSLFTLVVAHATFCIVIVYNNVAARLRRLAPSVEEASSDLGADMFQTFRFITFPLIRSALVAGGLLAFALSFDEIVVTTFTAGPGFETLPLWIFNNMFRPRSLPLVNVVATVVVLLSIIPVYIAQRITERGVVGVTQ
jgi:putative spermidine/putrescine transport system permease protein